jgi:hypothetical protein
LDVAQEPGELDGKETQKWDSMALERCVTGMAYRMRLMLQGIYKREDADEASKLFRNWCTWVHAMRGQTGELLEQVARAARMVKVQWWESWPIGLKV